MFTRKLMEARIKLHGMKIAKSGRNNVRQLQLHGIVGFPDSSAANLFENGL